MPGVNKRSFSGRISAQALVDNEWSASAGEPVPRLDPGVVPPGEVVLERQSLAGEGCKLKCKPPGCAKHGRPLRLEIKE